MLTTKKTAIILLSAGALAAGTAIAIDKRPDSPGPGASNKELVEAARRVYERCKQRLPVEPERSSIEDLYVWSKRWMTAEWDLNLEAGAGPKAVKDHFDRMTELENLTVKLHNGGQLSDVEVAAAEYYRVEAELMLSRAGGR